MSRLATASTSAWPIPGKPKTYSTTTTPPASQASCSAITWNVGGSGEHCKSHGRVEPRVPRERGDRPEQERQRNADDRRERNEDRGVDEAVVEQRRDLPPLLPEPIAEVAGHHAADPVRVLPWQRL